MSKKFMAEIIGTAVLVFIGCGAAVFLGANVGGGLLPVALAFGLTLAAMIYVIGNVSGCHINPAVSLAALLDKRITTKEFGGYVIAQVLGAIIGAGLLFALTQMFGITDITGSLGSNGVTSAGGVGGALIVETILTFVFVLVVLAVTSDESKSTIAGLVIGLALIAVIVVGITLTGTSVNPARSIGPALFAGGYYLANVWVFIVAPLLGGVLAAIVFRTFSAKAQKAK